MKIAFLNIFQGKVNRGAETFVDELAKRLAKNCQVDVLSGKAAPLSRWPILWRFFVDPSGLQILVFTLKNLPKILKEKYDIVIPTNGGWQPAFVRLVTWLYGGKMVISGQSGIGWDDRNNLWSFPDIFVGLTKKAKNWAGRANPFLRNIYHIPNGVDLTKFTPEGRKYKTALVSPIVLAVGAFTRQKRLDLVIKAVSRLGSASLLIAGGGGDRKEEFTKLGKELLGNRFRLISVGHDEMPAVYRTADVFTLASQASEAFGIAYVEAMATNIPVVALKDEQRREIIGRAGILVDPSNIAAYSIALENALRLKWGRRPLNQARKFDWDKIALKYEQLFLDLTK